MCSVLESFNTSFQDKEDRLGWSPADPHYSICSPAVLSLKINVQAPQIHTHYTCANINAPTYS